MREYAVAKQGLTLVRSPFRLRNALHCSPFSQPSAASFPTSGAASSANAPQVEALGQIPRTSHVHE